MAQSASRLSSRRKGQDIASFVRCSIRSGPAACTSSPMLIHVTTSLGCRRVARAGLSNSHQYTHTTSTIFFQTFFMSPSNQPLAFSLLSAFRAKYSSSRHAMFRHHRCTHSSKLPWDAARDASLDLEPGTGTACLSTDCKCVFPICDT